MNTTIHSSFLPHADPGMSVASYRDLPGFGVRPAVGHEGLRWSTVGPSGDFVHVQVTA